MPRTSPNNSTRKAGASATPTWKGAPAERDIVGSQPWIFTREGTRLVPADSWTAERLDDLPQGKHLKADKLTLPRSLPFQGYYWSTLRAIVQATECAATEDHLHKSLLKLCGYVQPTYNKNGDVIDWAVDSTAFEKMDDAPFKEYVEQAKKALAEHLNLVWDDYERK